MPTEFIKDKKIWDKLITNQDSGFMQSWDWGEFKEKLGHKIWRMAIKGNGQCQYAQIIKHRLPLKKSYFYIPQSPIFNSQLSTINHQPMELLIKDICKLAKKEKAVFIKWEPLAESSADIKRLKKAGFVESKNIQPKDTLVLDLSQTEEEIFQNFHSKHRYNIKLAQKKGIQIKILDSDGEFEEFYGLVKKTDERKHIKSFPKQYYKELFELAKKSAKTKTSPDLEIRFFGAYFGKNIAAGLVLVVWNDKAMYLIGANDYEYRQCMAPHLLQWETIKESRKIGAKEYDFWGIIRKEDFESDKEFEKHPWAGITRFKIGFGGKTVQFEKTFDYIVSPFWYKIYKLAIKLKM
ncbi:MAG: peptidoglycan bridge formation glycyltransferase FemA/FemB family protein [Candidatus Paceibacterota bacterium]|jgi:lipid II:glycine glycyltransferase (peptidoglycan interpeptide bridge formation enzyme)